MDSKITVPNQFYLDSVPVNDNICLCYSIIFKFRLHLTVSEQIILYIRKSHQKHIHYDDMVVTKE